MRVSDVISNVTKQNKTWTSWRQRTKLRVRLSLANARFASLLSKVMYIIKRKFKCLSWIWLLFHLMKWKKCIFHSCLRHSWNIHFFTSLDEIKVIFTPNIWISSIYSCLIHRLWLLVWTASNEYHTLCFNNIRKIMYTPVNPQFYYIKVGFKGAKVFAWCVLCWSCQALCIVITLLGKRGLVASVLFLTLVCGLYTITKTRLLKCTENFTSKNWNFSDKENAARRF